MNTNPPADFKSLSAQRPDHDRDRRAFTLTELLVVLVTLGILAVLLLPALANTQPASTKAFQCLNNMRQLAQAWTLYAEDNHDRLAINSDKSNPYPNTPNGTPSWIFGFMDWSTRPDNTNTAYLVNDTYSLLGSYLGRNYNVFACPADAYFVSPPEASVGWDHRARSVAMDAAVGNGNKYAGFPFSATFWWAKKMTDFHNPGPSDCWVFADEHPDSIDDGIFYCAPYPTTLFVERPGNQHGGAGSITFADGHVEIHEWQGPVANSPVKYQVQNQIPCSITDPDMLYLAQHTPQN
jgi:prepilin-type N-terminal cleavage/methylation domain-containing protein/prepilin-type processing-associated H-X9-DG protein